ncbi:MAG TPA: hypothetical protein VG425_10375 [Casimicrobiaceae bacterium]|nr:hypothetical protein [Casimicrobiaceae bacterium]
MTMTLGKVAFRHSAQGCVEENRLDLDFALFVEQVEPIRRKRYLSPAKRAARRLHAQHKFGFA